MPDIAFDNDSKIPYKYRQMNNLTGLAQPGSQ